MPHSTQFNSVTLARQARPAALVLAAAAVALAGVGLVVGLASGTDIVASVLGAAGIGNYSLATKIVDAILAGSAVAAAVGIFFSGGLSAAAYATIRWAISYFGKKQAVA